MVRDSAGRIPCSIDVTSDLLSLLDECWARPLPPEPYLVYLKMAYHLSQEARDGLIAYGLPADLRGTLLEHQAVSLRSSRPGRLTGSAA